MGERFRNRPGSGWDQCLPHPVTGKPDGREPQPVDRPVSVSPTCASVPLRTGQSTFLVRHIRSDHLRARPVRPCADKGSGAERRVTGRFLAGARNDKESWQDAGTFVGPDDRPPVLLAQTMVTPSAKAFVTGVRGAGTDSASLRRACGRPAAFHTLLFPVFSFLSPPPGCAACRLAGHFPRSQPLDGFQERIRDTRDHFIRPPDSMGHPRHRPASRTTSPTA